MLRLPVFLAEGICGRIEDCCREEEVVVAGEVPFDPGERDGRTVTRSVPATDALRRARFPGYCDAPGRFARR